MRSAASYRSALNCFERLIGPTKAEDANSENLDRFRDRMIADGMPRTSAASYCKHVRAAFGWAAKRGILLSAPTVKSGSTSRMRGRPLTVEEFERLLKAAAKVVGRSNAEPWRRVMRAMWAIGLRRSEILRLSWDEPGLIHFEGLGRKQPRIIFPAECHKAGRDCTLPLLPDAIELLGELPRDGRTGLVFSDLVGVRKRVRTAEGVGRIVAEIGKAAKVVTQKGADGEATFASAHDLRRSLGNRMAALGVAPQAIAAIMRHSSYSTTLTHYTALRPDQIADLAVPAFEKGCTLGCTDDSGVSETRDVSSVAKEP
jgi:integrase